MEIKLHKLARTTPRIREEIQSSQDSVRVLAQRYNVNESTIRRWRSRSSVEDRSHRPHRLASKITLTEESLICELRRRVGLSLDDITEVMRRCVNAQLSRSAIHRCLQRHHLSRPPVATPKASGQFETATCGFIHMDVKHLPKLQGQKSYAYVAIDRATRYVYVEILSDLKPQTAHNFLARFLDHFGYPVHTILTDNGFEWTDRFDGNRVRQGLTGPSGQHPFDRLCHHNGIRHTLTKPFSPQTNGMAERFNRRINEAIAAQPKVGTNQGKNTFLNHQERNAFIRRFVDDYNKTRLRCLNYQAPLHALASLLNHPGHYTKAGISGRVDSLTAAAKIAGQRSRFSPG